MSFTVTGFDKLEKQLKQLQKNAEALDGKHEIPFTELFNSAFMRKFTNFSSFEELLKAGGWDISTESDFEAIPDDEFDQHIKNTTRFNSWTKMQEEATGLYVQKKLGL